MRITAIQLKEKAKIYAKNRHVTAQEVLQYYMFERILFRLALSSYANKMVLKGGLLIASISGLSLRTTMDMDVSVKGVPLSDDQLHSVLNKVLSIDGNDGITFDIISTEVIRSEDEYGGTRFKVIGSLEHLRTHLSIDMSTDYIVKSDTTNYTYPLLFEDTSINIKAYSIEKIFAEKIQTILYQNGSKGRMKDYYDVHYFVTSQKKSFDLKRLKMAIITTFAYRDSLDDLNNAEIICNSISENNILSKRWSDYAKKHEYTKLLTFSDMMDSLRLSISIFMRNE
jgi:predicted nucleotidyltransferase component of viral defense system